MAKIFRKVLPIVGTVIGGIYGGPSGAAAGAQAGAAVSGALEPEVKVPKPKIIPVPDEEELARSRRRKTRSGGRAGTVFTDLSATSGPAATDRLGP